MENEIVKKNQCACIYSIARKNSILNQKKDIVFTSLVAIRLGARLLTPEYSSFHSSFLDNLSFEYNDGEEREIRT